MIVRGALKSACRRPIRERTRQMTSQPLPTRQMTSQPLPTRRQAIVMCAFVALTALTCAGLLCASALVPAPTVVLPFIVAVCIGFPMFTASQLHPAVAVLRAHGLGRSRNGRVLAEMRRYLDALPEVPHP